MATRIGSSASKHIATTRTVIPLTLENDQRRAPNATEGPNGAGHGDTMLERTLQKIRDEAPRPSGHDGAVEVALVAVVVDDYDEAIAFFVDGVGFELVEDSPTATNDGRPKRWVVVRPPGATTGILLARADGDEQRAVVGRQHAGRVGFFLRVDDFTEAHRRMTAAGVQFVGEPRDEQYGRVAVWVDIAGNRWDLLGPSPVTCAAPRRSRTRR